MMTKKHFKALADVIKLAADSGMSQQQLRAIAVGIALVCKRDNPAFNRDKFIEACGL